MVNSCCVINCYNRSQDRNGKRILNGVRFFSFPAWKQHLGPQISEITKRRRMAWIAAIKRKDITFNNISRHMFVCSRHFLSGKPAYEMLEYHPDWVPSLHLGHTEVKGPQSERLSRKAKREQTLAGNKTEPVQKSETDDEAPPDEFSQSLQMDETAPLDESSQSLQGDEFASSDESSPSLQMNEATPKDRAGEQDECHLCSSRRDEINRLLEENRLLKKELSQKQMGEDFLKDDDEKVEYYTGLPCFAVLNGVLTQLLPCLPRTCRKLSPFQMFFLTLMRLRLNVPVQHIAHLFCIDSKTVSTTFRDTIGAMFTHLSPLVHWPKRHCLQGSMTDEFVETFGNRVAVIVDCFEINADRASTHKTTAHTSSQHKHKHALKYLIGITPRGAIAFISKGWGGSISDKDVIESSGLLNKLLPGDLVLADHGFDTADDVGLMCAEVKMQKLVVKDVEETSKIAHLQVHLKRVIGCVRKKYPILGEPVPVNMVVPREGEDMVFLDKIVTVCCALTNMCPSVMKL